MTNPVSNQSHINLNVLYTEDTNLSLGLSSHENSRAIASARPKPGSGMTKVSGQRVLMTSVNESGFTSAFSTRNSAVIAQRSRLGINPQHAQQVLSQHKQLAAEARLAMQHIVSSQLNNFPQVKQHVDQLSLQHYQRMSAQYKNSISEALEDYQGMHGDNFIMNIAAMGFSDIKSYLKTRDAVFNDENKVNEFITDFAHHYSIFTGVDDEEDEIDELKSRLGDRLKEPTLQLARYIHNAPRLKNGIPLIKGATGGDNPLTTQLDGDKMLESALKGDFLHFNGFLSTSSKYDSALDFSGQMPSTGLGQPHYIIDLTKNDEKNEILRRHILRDLNQGNVDTGSLLFLFKANNAAGISVNVTQHAANPDGGEHRLSEEDEILMAPGHFFIPEQVIRNEEGIALIGSLNYGRK